MRIKTEETCANCGHDYDYHYESAEIPVRKGCIKCKCKKFKARKIKKHQQMKELRKIFKEPAEKNHRPQNPKVEGEIATPFEDKEGTKTLSEKIRKDMHFRDCGCNMIRDKDVKNSIKKLKDVKKTFSDIPTTCPICGKEKRLWVKDEDICYDCKIDKIFGKDLI